jgi:membrane protein implicated in regulation of membrane protease activity|uniref:NfeD family protein n=1 Tax=Candidatus Stercorousia sp. TaxID=3048886 RepID=UPI00402516BC
MVLWEIFAIAGLVFLILEMLVPSMFFLNLAIAGFITAIIALWINNWITLTILFAIFAILSIVFLRPILIKNKKNKETETGMEGKYIGKIVKVIEPIDKSSGAITIYDERWNARADVEEPIPAGSEVKIIKYDSLVLTVEKI